MTNIYISGPLSDCSLPAVLSLGYTRARAQTRRRIIVRYIHPSVHGRVGRFHGRVSLMWLDEIIIINNRIFLSHGRVGFVWLYRINKIIIYSPRQGELYQSLRHRINKVMDIYLTPGCIA